MKPLEKFLQPHDIESIFINIKVKREIIWTDTQISGVNIRLFQCFTWLWVFRRSWLKLIAVCWKTFETPFCISEPRIFTRCSLTTRKGMQQQLTHPTVCLNWSEQRMPFLLCLPAGCFCTAITAARWRQQASTWTKYQTRGRTSGWSWRWGRPTQSQIASTKPGRQKVALFFCSTVLDKQL